MNPIYYILEGKDLVEVNELEYDNWQESTGQHLQMEANHFAGLWHSMSTGFNGKKDRPDWKPFYFVYNSYINIGKPEQVLEYFDTFGEAATEFYSYLTRDWKKMNEPSAVTEDRME